MDKLVLNNGTSLDFGAINILSNGLAFTFTASTIDALKTALTDGNLSSIYLETSDGTKYATYNSLTCASIALIITDGSLVATLYQKDSTAEEITTLKQQVSEMLLAMVKGGLL